MKIICIGRNYSEHIKELNSPVPAEPVFFMKPDSALLTRNRPFYLPDFSTNVHYEVELVLRISKLGRNIQKKFAATYFDAIGPGLDITARDIQERAKKQGLPWLIAKGFDQSAPIGKFLPKESFKDLNDISFHLDLNGKTVQQGNSSEMIFSFEDIISYISRFMTLRTGDLIFTGTPSGVGPLKIGDRLEAFIGDARLLTCPVK